MTIITYTWEQRKLGEIATFSKGNGYSKSDLLDKGTPIILYGSLYTNYRTTITNSSTFVKIKNKAIYSTGKEVIVPASGETSVDIARASAVTKSGILLGGDLNIIYPQSFLNSIFLSLSISNGEPKKMLSNMAQGKSVVHIHNSDLKKLSILFPTNKEQNKIELVFEELDNLITLHQRK